MLWTAVCVVWISLLHTSTAHVALTFPPARKFDLDFLDSFRTKAPCGMPKAESPSKIKPAASTPGVMSDGITNVSSVSTGVRKKPTHRGKRSRKRGRRKSTVLRNMANKFSSIKLKSGYDMPVFGLGTWKSKPGVVREAVETALDLGYRHIDCARIYGNEKEVGQALKSKLDDGTVKRDELFITGKLWSTCHSASLVVSSLKESLEDLGLEYLDLYLIHWPIGFKEGGDLVPKDGAGEVQLSDVDYVDTWRGMEECVTAGLARSIGVSNFNEQQLERVFAVANQPVSVNQVECHPYLTQKKLMEFCKGRDIAITAYSPLGSPDRPWAKPGDVELMQEPRLKTVADKYNKSVAQLLIRYQLQRGNIVIPKSTTASRLRENMQVLDFELSADDVATVESFDRGARFCGVPWLKHSKYHPFPEVTAEQA